MPASLAADLIDSVLAVRQALSAPTWLKPSTIFFCAKAIDGVARVAMAAATRVAERMARRWMVMVVVSCRSCAACEGGLWPACGRSMSSLHQWAGMLGSGCISGKSFYGTYPYRNGYARHPPVEARPVTRRIATRCAAHIGLDPSRVRPGAQA